MQNLICTSIEVLLVRILVDSTSIRMIRISLQYAHKDTAGTAVRSTSTTVPVEYSIRILNLVRTKIWTYGRRTTVPYSIGIL